MRTGLVLALLTTFASVAVCAAEAPPGVGDAAAASYKTEEVSLGPIPANDVRCAFSRDGCHFAFVLAKGDKWCLVLDGQAGSEYDKIGNLVFSPDGKRLAYVAKRGDKQFVILDGREGPEYDGILGNLLFGGDGKRLAYRAKRG
ncbi:MAG TPA: hypothetical protein VMW52_13705, partial [Phycisphaerae bacterium]|nr:hypothetical protein [Phycisphaerae bacterium]